MLQRASQCSTLTLVVLEQEKTKAREALTRLSHVTPADLSTTLQHRYYLRGVATKPNVTYILRPASQHDSQQDTEMFTDSDAPPGMQWWRIEYVVNATNSRILKTRSTTDDVLRAVELEHTQALLVYASERAITFETNPDLPRGLKRFVELDNEQFATEILDHQDFQPRGWTTQPPSSRRQSIDSTTVNIDDGAMHDDLPPAYDFGEHARGWEDEKAPLVDPTQMSGVESGYDSPPAHEIRLDDEDEGHEMIETGSGMFNPSQEDKRRSDSTMMDVGREAEQENKKPDIHEEDQAKRVYE